MPINTWESYNSTSEFFFESYEKLRFSKVHRSFLPFLPEKGALCLDVGAGSGRDAAALSKRGYRVIAVEPSEGMRKHAQRRYEKHDILWLDDHLPDLSETKRQAEQFSFILVSAVWMHLPRQTWDQAFQSLKGLLTDTGHIAISLREGADNIDRGMLTVNLDELLSCAKQHGLAPVYVSRRTKDSLSRAHVSWKKLVLKKLITAQNHSPKPSSGYTCC